VGTKVDQEHYIEQLLAHHAMDKCKPVGTPLPVRTVLCKYTANSTSEEDQLLSEKEAYRFREITGSLLLLVMCARPDLAVATNQLTQQMAMPTQAHMRAAKHVLRYLRGSSTVALHYSASPSVLHGYVDASFGNEHKARSVSGHVFLLNGAAVSWKSRVQRTVALSSAEAEYMSLSDAVRECIYLRHLLADMKGDVQGPTVMYEDNQPCIHIANNPVTSSRTKHINIRYHFTREAVFNKEIRLVYCATENMLADALTKIVPKPVHEYLRGLINGDQS
jgi:hypothetical protein